MERPTQSYPEASLETLDEMRRHFGEFERAHFEEIMNELAGEGENE